MKRLAVLFSLVLLNFSFNSKAQSVNTFVFTGTSEYLTIPSGVTSIFVTATGASGGCDTLSGAGAQVCDTISVTPGMMLEINVGGQGMMTQGGWNGGGDGGTALDSAHMACGGGGASDVRVAPFALGDRILVAGGGGGKGGGATPQAEGGSAACPDGTAGGNGWVTGGGGATVSIPGAGGAPWGAGNTGENGVLGVGGAGAVDTCFNEAPGGGGGGGWYGGGGGAADCFTGTGTGGGGGAGSSLYSGAGCCTANFNFNGPGTVVVEYYQLNTVATEDLNFLMYPNPADQMLSIEMNNGNETHQVFLIDLSGQIVQTYQMDNNSMMIDLSQIPAGIYFVKIQDDFQKLVIE